jgi:hypothetical protein
MTRAIKEGFDIFGLAFRPVIPTVVPNDDRTAEKF